MSLERVLVKKDLNYVTILQLMHFLIKFKPAAAGLKFEFNIHESILLGMGNVHDG